ncbi:ABC transporter permease subunit [Neobacillus rhizophilus]|uniref:Autoinducer 2 import system permease protein LsrC n=1 Tax=Neobacillus rhizophilus TaxID=2833579 RepID=A0A942U3B7_9BACI|nr:sugar ABC transporter permease [Neobacillus rhizophilus]MBS4213880.1 sugar ABC transporter permease [Neobacillus rhizophilus]
MNLLSKIMKQREISIVVLIVVFIAIVGMVNSKFVTGKSLLLLVESAIILLILAVGQSFVLLTREIDVSVGATMGLSAAVCGLLLTSGVSGWVSALAVLAVGVLAGLFNGLGVAYLRIPAIIMTLGTLGILRGFMIILTGGKWIEDIPNYFKKLSGTDFIGLPLPVWIGLVILVAAYLVLRLTKFGRYFYAVGDNADGARLIGIPVSKVRVLAFVLSGLSASVAGLIFVINIGFVPNQTGSGMELQVIAAAVLGGVSLNGGLGTVLGAGLGAIFLTAINSSLIYLKIPAYWNNAISGFLLLVIVISDSRFQSFLANSQFKKKETAEAEGGGQGDEATL